MVVLQKSENQFYADIVRSLKQNFRTEVEPCSVAHGERKVRIRTDCHYKSELSDDHWREKYNRHVSQSARGFYTPAYVPYASVGDVCLDVRDLVVKTVGGDQSSERCKNLYLIADPSEQERNKDEKGATAGPKRKLQRSKKRACFSFQDQGGMNEIKGKLVQYRRRLSAVRAGQAFEKCLVKEDVMLMVTEAMKPVTSPAIKLKQMLNKLRPSERIDAPVLGDELIPAFPSEIDSDQEEESSDQRDVHDRHVRNFSSKLSCLYLLLCYIYHLRTRDLRTRAPLSRDFLKTLKTEVITDPKGKPLRHTRNMSHVQPFSRGAVIQRSSTDATVSRLDQDNHLSPHMYTRASLVSESPSSLFRSGITAAGAVESRASFVGRKRIRDTSDKVETWDDLLEAGEKQPSNLQAPWPGMTRGGAGNEPATRGTRTSFLHTAKLVQGGMRQRRYGTLQSLVNPTQNTASVEQGPLWHQIAASEKNAKDSGTTFQKRRVKKSPFKVESLLSEGFVKIQAKSAERVRDRLEKVKRRERESFVKKVLAFNPSSFYNVDLKRIRQAGRYITEEYNKEHVKTARWYGELEQEAQELGVGKKLEVVCLFNKLYPFAIDDVDTLPFVQAKLCLVVQSLPVYELCCLTMLDALKFLHEKILRGPSGMVYEWMNHRKLLLGDKSS